jgi:cytochrome P450
MLLVFRARFSCLLSVEITLIIFFFSRDAVIHEALRIHPNTGLILERVVPTEGAIIDNHALPGGTIVGVNSWVLHRNLDIFGLDVDVFRPERWLESPEQKVLEMKRYLFSVSFTSYSTLFHFHE